MRQVGWTGGLLLCLSSSLLCGAESAVNTTVSCGSDVAPVICNRTRFWLTQVAVTAPSVSLFLGSASRGVIPDAEVALAGSEGYVLRSICGTDGSVQVHARGNPRAGCAYGSGNHYGAYAALESLGAHFLHPLEPTVTPLTAAGNAALCHLSETSSPHWPNRIWHYHTMHPLEMTDLFNGVGSLLSNQASAQCTNPVHWLSTLTQCCSPTRAGPP